MVGLISDFLVEGPMWAIAVVLFGGMLASAALGYGLRSRQMAARPVGGADDEDRTNEGIMVSAVFGLFALLTGFTFAMAIDRYDARRHAVLDEANMIGTAYLRSQLLEEPHRGRMSAVLLDYTRQRVALAKADTSEAANALVARNDALVAELWDTTAAAYPTFRTLPFSGAYLDSINAVIDQDTVRKMSRFAHVPPPVLLLLFVYALSAAGVIGFVLARNNGRASATLLFFLFGSSLLLILDIDRPRSGMIQESQQPMILLLADLERRAALPAPQPPPAP